MFTSENAGTSNVYTKSDGHGLEPCIIACACMDQLPGYAEDDVTLVVMFTIELGKDDFMNVVISATACDSERAECTPVDR